MRIIVYGMTAKRGGGIEEVLMNYLRNRKKEIEYIYMVSGDHSEYSDEIERLNGKIIYITPKEKSTLSNLKDLASVLNSYSKNDIIYFNAGALYYGFPYVLSYIMGYRNIVVHAHNGKNCDRKFYEQLIHYINRFVINHIVRMRLSCSDYATDWIFGRRYRKKVYKINNAVNVERYVFDKVKRDRFRKEHELDGKFVIGNIGRFARQKNHKFILEIFNELTKLDRDVQLILVGNRDDKFPEVYDDTVKYVYEHKLEDKVEVLPVSPNIESVYSGIDVLVMPSLYEGLSLVSVEAQISGLLIFVPEETVSPEIEITENVRWLNLSMSPLTWAKEILKAKEGLTSRKTRSEEVINAGFEINQIVGKIEHIFSEMEKKS